MYLFTCRLGATYLALVASLIIVQRAHAGFFTNSSLLPVDSEVITFETGSTVLPSVPGATFVNESTGTSDFLGSGNFEGFFGSQGWSNSVSSTYSDLAIEFDTPMQVVGAWVGRIPNFTNEHPNQIIFELFDESSSSLGAMALVLRPFFNAPLFIGFESTVGIARAEWRGIDSGFFGVDNVTYLQVPEPSGIVTITCGAFLLLPLLWRHRRSGRRRNAGRGGR